MKTVEISILKGKNLVDINRRMQAATDEENRLADLLTPEDDGTTPELQATQTLRNELFEQIINIMDNLEEITYFRGYSFVDVFFNTDKIYGYAFEITREQVAQFITECNLVLENPEVGGSILPINPGMEKPKYAEDDEYHEEPIYYDNDYIERVRNAKEVFTDILNNSDWVNDAILLQIIV